MRPDIVWFGEVPYYLEEIRQALETVNIFVCIGTSGVIYPAAGIARQAASKGAKRLIEINLDDTGISTHFTEHRQGSASAEVPNLVEELISSIPPYCLS